MLNIIRADLYRISRGKGFYITTALLLLTIGLDRASSNADNSFYAMGDIVVLLIYFILPFIIFVCAADFSSKTIINVLSNGTPRAKYYLSKLILSCAFCIFVLFLNIFSAFIIEIARNNFRDVFTMMLTGNIMRTFFAEMLMCITVTCVGVFFVFSTQKTSAAIGAYIALFWAPYFIFNTIIAIFFDRDHSLAYLYNFDFSYNLARIAQMDTWSPAEITRVFAISAFYLSASTIGGILVFKRSEIKWKI
jgi:ABC-2 type transport system permease protein